MKWTLKYTNNIEERLLIYLANECSFDMDPVSPFVDFSLYINRICLTVLRVNRVTKVIEVSGFCPYGNWQNTIYTIPDHPKGDLIVLNKIRSGLAYRLNEEDWPEYINLNTGWVCIGDPAKTGQAVEFIRNCVAVLEGDQLVALWLKPETLPVKEIEDFRREQGIV